MAMSLEALATRFKEHQKRFFANGGKPKAIKYPEEWRTDAATLRRQLRMPLADMARELGVGHSALKRWCEEAKGAKPKRQPASHFVPVEVMADAPRADGGAVRRISVREISVDIDASASDDAIAAVIAALARSGGTRSC